MSVTLLQIACGGAIGAVLRYLTGLGALKLLGAGFPFGTLTVNILGSFLMGLCAVWLAGGRISPLIMTGVLGGFTTFSAFSLDAVALWEKGQAMGAAIYVILSVSGAILALMAGMLVARAAAS